MASSDQPLSQNPIFVVGYPRSGTTLLQALLATQNKLATFPETHFFCTVFAKNTDFRETISLESARDILKKISQISGITFEDGFLSRLKNDSDTIFIKEFFESIVCKLFPANTPISRRWLEKTPDHGIYMTQISRYYPEAKFVGIVRNPFFAIYSRTKYFPPQVPDLLKFLATKWDVHVRAFEEFSARNPSRTFLVKYEELTQNPAAIIAAVCEFLQLSFDQNKLENYQQKADSIVRPFEHWKKDVKTSQIFTKNENPKSIFSIKEILNIQSVVLESMGKHGYEQQYPLMQRIYSLFVQPD